MGNRIVVICTARDKVQRLQYETRCTMSTLNKIINIVVHEITSSCYEIGSATSIHVLCIYNATFYSAYFYAPKIFPRYKLNRLNTMLFEKVFSNSEPGITNMRVLTLQT